MLRLRALTCVFTVGLISAFSQANDPVAIPVFPGSSQPPAQAVVSPAPAQAAPAQAKMAEPIPISPTMQGYGAGMMPPPAPSLRLAHLCPLQQFQPGSLSYRLSRRSFSFYWALPSLSQSSPGMALGEIGMG